MVPVIWVLHICWESQAISALLSMNWAPQTYLSCLHCSVAGQAFEEQERAQLTPKGHCQCIAHCQARPWPPSRRLLALFKAGCLHSMHVMSFFPFRGFLPGWKAGNMSSFFTLGPFIFFLLSSKHIDNVFHAENARQIMAAVISLQSIKPFKAHYRECKEWVVMWGVTESTFISYVS